MDTHIVMIDCTDEKGLVHKITGVFFHNNLNVISNQEFVQPESNRFFMRSVIHGDLDKHKVISGLIGILPSDAQIKISLKEKKNIVILVTKEHHCLGEILIRHQFDEINANIVAVIGNHNSLENLVNRFNIPFHHIDAKDLGRDEHETQVLACIDGYNPNYIVLAKYMRILTPTFVEKYPNKIINIHHSFLPAFIGANPYRQAYNRGVKIIGATAHFVNNVLDEGPIIMQDVMHVDHTQSPQEMAQAGRDGEKIVLAQALQLVFNDHVFVSGNKTIIFR